jgi:hypothetical protein
VMVTVAVRRAGARGLHRAGGVAIGAAAAFVVLPLLDFARGGGYSFWSGEDPLLWNDRSPLWLAALGLLMVPAIVDFWVPAAVQRLLVVVAIAGAVGAWVLYPARPGPIPYLLYLLVLGLCTRADGHRDRGTLLGLGVGLPTVLMVGLSGTISLDLSYLQVVGSAITLLVPASVVVLAAVGFSGQAWWGPVAFAVAALWLAAVGGVQILPLMVVAAGLSMVGLVVARFWPYSSRPIGPIGESG